MKSLMQHIEERLIINQNYKNVDDINELFDNVNFKHINDYILSTIDDIFSIMVDYIRDHNIRSFSDFDSYKKTSQEGRHVCLVIFNKRIKEMNVFQKISDDNYKTLIIFKKYTYIFKRVERLSISMHTLRNSDTWNNTDEVEYYEISEKTFDDISELYNELIKK